MTRLLLFAVAIAVAGFFALYFVIGSAFMLGEPLPHGQHISNVFGLLGFVGPLILVCVHFVTTTPDWTLRARKRMLWAYGFIVLVAFVGVAPQLFFAETRLPVAEEMAKLAVWCGLCGAPIIAAWLNAVGDQRPK
ncbi:MAG: hypothetical protein U1E06_15920 [Tabrizicola sp.]|uniref:hypothetical protein n=1 Tax=Tabrizicola sp. TaxID=2005166 RepID=UPI002733A3CB|nr:hypothetical protein [Tabrizicola sp.]MDP3264002.1 hypothetical protein [Tabrizicola sp.]MDP3649638.1 hypothetical protein [Paracoccaceae bacterium]MDZ4068314.1 hypothetical protein [Tabrizicola sp.]